jgi:tetratricopeptide (TPR) repeat protein
VTTPDRSSLSRILIAIGGLLLVIGGLVVVFLVRPARDDPRPENGGPPDQPIVLTPAAAIELIEVKNRGIALLENERYDESDSRFSEVVERLPGEPLGHRNLAVSRLLALSTADPRDTAKYAPAVAQAEAAVGRLLEVEPDSAAAHLLASRLAKTMSQSDRARELIERATRLAPDDVAMWYELFQAGRDSDEPEVRSQARSALQRAYELEPDNLFLLMDWLSTQIAAQDSDVVETLDQVRDVLGPFVEHIRRLRRVDLLQFLDQARQAAEDGNWQVAFGRVGVIGNLMRPEVASQLDHRRVAPHELEFILLDFSPDFYERADLPDPEQPPAISVKLVSVTGERGLPELADVREVLLVDFDLDGRLDVVVLQTRKLTVLGRDENGAGWRTLAEFDLPRDMHGVLAADFDRDIRPLHGVAGSPATGPVAADAQAGDEPQPAADTSACHDSDVDLAVFGPGGLLILQNKLDPDSGQRSLEVMPQDEPFEALRDVQRAVAIDVDHDGDLDLVVASEQGISIWSNRDDFTFEDISARSVFPPADLQVTDIVPVDFNRNVDIDLLVAGPELRTGLLENTLHSRFRWREFGPEYEGLEGTTALAVIDADGNASWDILAGGSQGVHLIQTRNQVAGVVHFLKSTKISDTLVDGLKTWDFDNDGYLDLLTWGENGLEIYRGGPGGQFERRDDLFEQQPGQIVACDIGDLDGDGGLDLVVSGPQGLVWYRNEGGNRNNWINIALRAEPVAQRPAERTNMHGIGSLLELKVGPLYQPRVVSRPTTHFGLGQHERADAIRVLWPNGIPHNVINAETNQSVCEQQHLKGSCPYLYTWAGTRYEFFTDCLWSAPIGLQWEEGVLAPSREWEYLLIPGERLVAHNGEYRLQMTEELWEAAYFDTVELWAVDHPADIEVYSNEKVGPAEIAAFKVHTVRHPRVPVAARDQRGRDVLDKIAVRGDDIYLKAFDRTIKQGLTEEHYLELDLGELPNPESVTLFLTGWVFPTDTSLNIAIAQNPAVPAPRPPALWVPDAEGRWQEVIPYIGFPGGKTKTIAVEIPGDVFAPGDYRVRIVTSMEVYWDAAMFAIDEQPAELNITPLPLASADLHYRGFSKRIPHPQHGPEHYDYEDVSTEPLWPPMAGRFTRYGDVTEIIRQNDDRLVVLGAGDELTLKFTVPPHDPPAGWKRDFILYNVGWDKDADLHTVYGQTVEPLPFRDMGEYPYPIGVDFPDSPAHRDYLRTYQTREQSYTRFWNQIRDFEPVRRPENN